MINLRPFQRTFIKNATREDVTIAGLCLPRGNGKSTLSGHLAARVLSPGDAMFRAASESVLVAGSIEQARIVFRVARGFLGEAEYRYLDSNTRIGITHKETNTKLRIIGSNGKTAMGLLDCPWAICDEPGAWEINSGGMVWDALTTARGKPDSPLTILIVGTLAPSATGPGHWWWDLVDGGTTGDTYIMALRGDASKWDSWSEIRRCNPLTAVSAQFRRQLLKERDEARIDPRKKASFLSYRLNRPTGDESTMLLTLDDWKAVEARAVPERKGRAIVGVDLAGGRAWSAAVAVYPNGLLDAIAVAPGIPTLEEQEKRDRVPAGTYQRLADAGLLLTADGLRVPPPKLLWDAICQEWGKPQYLICDRFRVPELKDAVKHGARIEERVTRWSEAAFDIRALRKGAKDGPFTVTPESRLLLAASLSVAMVKNDDAGNTRLVKRGFNNTSRDDVAAALLLAAGAHARKPVNRGVRSLGLAG